MDSGPYDYFIHQNLLKQDPITSKFLSGPAPVIRSKRLVIRPLVICSLRQYSV
jgi:hypothetical protein